jgi:hypothetical protein
VERLYDSARYNIRLVNTMHLSPIPNKSSDHSHTVHLLFILRVGFDSSFCACTFQNASPNHSPNLLPKNTSPIDPCRPRNFSIVVPLLSTPSQRPCSRCRILPSMSTPPPPPLPARNRTSIRTLEALPSGPSLADAVAVRGGTARPTRIQSDRSCWF